MKKIGILVAALSLGSIVVSCKSSTEKTEEAQAEMDHERNDVHNDTLSIVAVDKDSQSGYAKLKAETNEMIVTNERKIAEFKVKMKGEKADIQTSLDKKIAVLEAKNTQLKKDLNEYTEEGKEKWNAFKTRVQKSMDDINKDIEDYKKEHNY